MSFRGGFRYQTDYRRQVEGVKNASSEMAAKFVRDALREDLFPAIRDLAPASWLVQETPSSLYLSPRGEVLPSIKVTLNPIRLYLDTGTRREPKSEVFKPGSIADLVQLVAEVMPSLAEST